MKAVSIIIPSYQSAKWLPRTIESCLKQKDFIREIIIVDDHSTDGSWDIASSYQARHPDAIRLFRNKSKGGNHARNYGFELSTGEFIQWLDADDLLLANKLHEQSGILQNDPLTDIVYSDWKLHIYDDDKLVRELDKKQEAHDDFLWEILKDNWSPPHNYLVRRSMAERLHEIGAWNPDTKVAQDREYFTMAALLGAKFLYAPGFFCVYNRWNKSSVSAAKKELRYLHLERIYNRILEEIKKQKWIPEVIKLKYRNVILTQKCLLLAYGSASDTGNYKIGFSDIYWPIVNGYRTTLKLVLAILMLRFKQ